MASFLMFTCRKGQKITLCTQYRYIQCYVERVESYVIDTFNATKGSKDYVIHNLDTFNATKGLKDYVMLKQGTYTCS